MIAIAVRAESYDPVAKALHWLTVALLCTQYAIAFTMPEIHRETPAEGLVALHLSFGATIFVVTVLRLVWRFTRATVQPPEHLAPWQAFAARATHGLLYVMLLVVPLLGWAHASYRGYAVSLFDVIPLPALVPKGSPLGRPLGDVHTLMAYGLLGVIGLHVAAALYHRFLLRDEVLQRMLPARLS